MIISLFSGVFSDGEANSASREKENDDYSEFT
jgi:hypothetical protein